GEIAHLPGVERDRGDHALLLTLRGSGCRQPCQRDDMVAEMIASRLWRECFRDPEYARSLPNVHRRYDGVGVSVLSIQGLVEIGENAPRISDPDRHDVARKREHIEEPDALVGGAQIARSQLQRRARRGDQLMGERRAAADEQVLMAELDAVREGA